MLKTCVRLFVAHDPGWGSWDIFLLRGLIATLSEPRGESVETETNWPCEYAICTDYFGSGTAANSRFSCGVMMLLQVLLPMCRKYVSVG